MTRRFCRRLLTVCFSVVPLQAAIVFSDGVFNLANYSAPVTYNPQSISVTNTQISSGGNPNEAIQSILTFAGDFNYAEALIRPSFSYDPSTQGAIVGIDTRVDRYFDSQGQANGSTLGGSWVLLQSGNYYRATSPGVVVGAPVWNTYTLTGSTAADWNLFDFTTGNTDTTSHPNFSSSGSPIQFGYTFRLASVFGTSGSWELRGDNLTYAINTVPEPNPALLIVGASAVLLIRLRRTA